MNRLREGYKKNNPEKIEYANFVAGYVKKNKNPKLSKKRAAAGKISFFSQHGNKTLIEISEYFKELRKRRK